MSKPSAIDWKQQAGFWGSLATGGDPYWTYLCACQAATAAQRYLNPDHEKSF